MIARGLVVVTLTALLGCTYELGEFHVDGDDSGITGPSASSSSSTSSSSSRD